MTEYVTANARQPTPTGRPPQSVLQRACACGRHVGAGGECEACRKQRKGTLQRAAVNTAVLDQAPPIVYEALRGPGQPLDTATRDFMEPRFGYDFSQVSTRAQGGASATAGLAISAPDDVAERNAEQTAGHIMSQAAPLIDARQDFSGVRIHTDARARASAQAIGALAYTVGNDIVFGAGQFAPGTAKGRHLLAHELTHVAQQGAIVRPYRPKDAFNFGKNDDATLIEDSFNLKKDKETKPWIRLVKVEFTTKKADTDGNNAWVGTATAYYYDNPAKFANFTFAVTGGSAELGKTDKGSFTVHRIEGIGYNSGSFSGTEGVDYKASEREGPRKRYSKDLRGNMSYAVFYNKGEALHAGPLDYSSHGCVHVDWTDYTNIKQLNYHSVKGLTKVEVKYP